MSSCSSRRDGTHSRFCRYCPWLVRLWGIFIIGMAIYPMAFDKIMLIAAPFTALAGLIVFCVARYACACGHSWDFAGPRLMRVLGAGLFPIGIILAQQNPIVGSTGHLFTGSGFLLVFFSRKLWEFAKKEFNTPYPPEEKGPEDEVK